MSLQMHMYGVITDGGFSRFMLCSIIHATVCEYSGVQRIGDYSVQTVFSSTGQNMDDRAQSVKQQLTRNHTNLSLLLPMVRHAAQHTGSE